MTRGRDEPGFTVRDRRFVRPDGETADGDDAETSPREPSKPSYVEELENQVAAKERELRELIATYKRDVTQTVEDTKQRLLRDALKQAEIDRARLVEALLPVLDNLTLAISHARGAAQKPGDSPLLKGVLLVEKQFLEKLAGLGVERLVSLGQPFDPKLHEAVATVPAAPEQDGLVVAEMRPGFRMGERVIRAAMVQVGRA